MFRDYDAADVVVLTIYLLVPYVLFKHIVGDPTYW